MQKYHCNNVHTGGYKIRYKHSFWCKANHNFGARSMIHCNPSSEQVKPLLKLRHLRLNIKHHHCSCGNRCHLDQQKKFHYDFIIIIIISKIVMVYISVIENPQLPTFSWLLVASLSSVTRWRALILARRWPQRGHLDGCQPQGGEQKEPKSKMCVAATKHGPVCHSHYRSRSERQERIE